MTFAETSCQLKLTLKEGSDLDGFNWTLNKGIMLAPMIHRQAKQANMVNEENFDFMKIYFWRYLFKYQYRN
jgi:hypothetical protein